MQTRDKSFLRKTSGLEKLTGNDLDVLRVLYGDRGCYGGCR